MVVFGILFLLILAISLLLAHLSMRDFEESAKLPSSRYLLKSSSQLNLTLLKNLAKRGEIFSVERLFKGSKSALVIYGPAPPDFLELEEYANFPSHTTCFEIEVSKRGGSFFKHFPKLEEDEQVFWQLVVKPQKEDKFRGQARVAVLSPDSLRRRKLSKNLKLSQTSMLKYYKRRSIVGRGEMFESEEIIKGFKL